jgi:hypothetical protein
VVNLPLANYLLWVVSDPQRLANFNNPGLRNDMIDSSEGLTEDDKTALRSGNMTTVLQQLNAGSDDVMWVLAPVGTEGFALGLGIKIPTPPPPPPPMRLSAAARRPAKKVAKARKSTKTAKSKTAKSSRRPKGRR